MPLNINLIFPELSMPNLPDMKKKHLQDSIFYTDLEILSVFSKYFHLIALVDRLGEKSCELMVLMLCGIVKRVKVTTVLDALMLNISLKPNSETLERNKIRKN